MIQEKDFLYRVPVKTALTTTPRGQIRNPEILVDLEGGEFTHGDILDANSTNKLIDQSVKDAIDNSIENGNYVTKDLLEAETSARTKSDEDLNAKIKAEQTRAEGKEKEISDKLAGNYDLRTALNQAITEKADAYALANEVTRATGAESGLQAAIATKADATALSNYVLTTALNQQVDTLNTAISAKQDKPDDGNMFLQVKHDSVSGWFKREGELKFTHDDNDSYYTTISPSGIYCWSDNSSTNFLRINNDGIELDGGQGTSGYAFTTDGKTAHIPTKTSQLLIDSSGIVIGDINNPNVKISSEGIKFANKSDKEIPTADGTFIVVDDFASIDDVSSLRAGLSRKQNKITVNEVDITDIETADITKLRTIVTNLINALSASDLIRKTITLE